MSSMYRGTIPYNVVDGYLMKYAWGGTGLGMIISKKAVELHGGTIAIQSKVGIGTTITVEIPVVTEKELS